MALVIPADAQSRKERKAAKLEESAKPKKVSVGETFQASCRYDRAYDVVLNFLKRKEHMIDSADKETGQIITSIDIEGGYSQTGTRIQITLIKDSDTATTLRVAVTKQKRKKLLQTEPWSDPKVDDDQSKKMAEDVKAALKGAESAG